MECRTATIVAEYCSVADAQQSAIRRGTNVQPKRCGGVIERLMAV